MAKNDFDLIQTKGNFQICGIVSGVKSDNFYKEDISTTGNPYRKISFAVEINNGKKIYCSLFASPKKDVYFYKKGEEKASGITKSVSWDNRYNFKEEGFSLIGGVNIGLEKTVDVIGKVVNKRIVLTEYDACEEIGNKLKDGMSVFVKGKIEHSVYKDKCQTNFIPTQISLCSKDVDFEAENFKERAEFEETICYMGTELNSETKEAHVTAKSIGYMKICDTEYIIKNATLAKTFKNKLKPYTSIRVSGKIEIIIETEEIDDVDDIWGESNPMRMVSAPTIRNLIITGAEPDTIDKEIYSEKIIDDALSKIKASKDAKNDFKTLTGKDTKSSDDWGSSIDFSNDDDDVWD